MVKSGRHVKRLVSILLLITLSYSLFGNVVVRSVGEGLNPLDDTDKDSIYDVFDRFPQDSSESEDTDGDGVGNRGDPDDDNDGVPDEKDAFYYDSTKSVAKHSFIVCASMPTSWDTENSWNSFTSNLDILDVVNPYWYEMQADGSLNVYGGARNRDLTDIAHSNEILVAPYVTNAFDPERVHQVITDPDKTVHHIQNIVQETVENSYDGVNIDYESCYASDRDAFTRFIQNLAVALHNQGKILEVSFHAKTSEPGDWDGAISQDWEALAPVVDCFRVMTYDYHWETSLPGPIAPVDWIRDVTDFALTVVDPGRLVMGVPFYGYDWVGSKADGKTWLEVQDIILKYEIDPDWDSSANEPFFQYHDGSNSHTVYYQNSESITYKLDVFYECNVKGVSIWRIGGEDPENWNVISNLLGPDSGGRGGRAVKDEYIVKLKDIGKDPGGPGEKSRSRIIDHAGKILAEHKGLKALRVKVPESSRTSFLQKMLEDKNVVWVEPNYLIKVDMSPNDPSWSIQWGPQKIGAAEAWDLEQGSQTVLVVVIDTGVDYTHPDLASNYVAGGYDWVNDDGDPLDDHGHGTHCAGIIAATINNGLGIAGLPQVKVMGEKFLDSGGYGSAWDAAEAITRAVDVGKTISNRIVLSNSWGSYGSSNIVKEAMAYAYQNGVLIAAASGNDASSSPHYPSAYPEVISVSATDSNDQLAGFSNYGSTIELTAPGVSIYSTITDGDYASWSGTSMACPHVSGVAALIWSEFPEYTRDQVRELLRSSSDDLGSPGWDQYFGYGRLNAANAVQGLGVFPPKHKISWTAQGLPSGWLNSGGTAVTGIAKHNGAYGAYLKSYNTDPSGGWMAQIYQDVTIPGGVDSATLSFWYYYSSEEYELGWDYFYMQIRDLNDVVLATVVSHSLSGEVPWTQMTYDLTAYVGETVRLNFLNDEYPDDLYASYAYVDDVSVEYMKTGEHVECVCNGGFETGSFNPPDSVTLRVNGAVVANIPPSYSNFYAEGSSLSFSVPNFVTVSGASYVFDCWSDGAAAPSHSSVIVSSSQSFVAYYVEHCNVTFDSDPRVASITVDDVTYTPSELPKTFSWAPGHSHSFSVGPAVSGGTGVQYTFIEWSDGNTSTSRTVTITASTSYTANFKTQHFLTVNTYPAGLDTPDGEGWYDGGANASVSISEVSGHTFQYWYLDGQTTIPYSYDLTTTVEMDKPHMLTAYFKAASSITLSISNSSLSYGSSITLNGSIIPGHSEVSIELSHSTDNGTSWSSFMFVKTDVNGGFETIWTPPYPLTYLVKASWNGDRHHLGATSGEQLVKVTGTMPSQPSVLITLENTHFSRGETTTITVTIFNPTDIMLESELHVEVVGPIGYYHYDFRSIIASGRSESSYSFDWQIPFGVRAGTYLISTRLVPSWLGAYDTEYVQVE